jgi:hypothetical protein
LRESKRRYALNEVIWTLFFDNVSLVGSAQARKKRYPDCMHSEGVFFSDQHIYIHRSHSFPSKNMY